MSDAEIYLWPCLAFLLLAAAGAVWQWRNAPAEAAARQRLVDRDRSLPRWRQMPNWRCYHAQLQDPERLRRSAGRRALALLLASLALLAWLLLRR